jgi:hypothetical protein
VLPLFALELATLPPAKELLLMFAPVRCWYAARRFFDVADPTLYTLVVREWILAGDSGGVVVVVVDTVGYCPDDVKL